MNPCAGRIFGSSLSIPNNKIAPSDRVSNQIDYTALMERKIGEGHHEKRDSKKASKEMTPLPEGFEPGDHDVICGRGRTIWTSPGNINFRRHIESKVDEYAAAKTKLDKSAILSSIAADIRKASPNGGFVRKDTTTGRWFEVGDFLAREKISQAFRDALHDSYRSSNRTKRKRRIEEQAISAEINAEMQRVALEQLQSGRTDKNLYEIICQQQSILDRAQQLPQRPVMREDTKLPAISLGQAPRLSDMNTIARLPDDIVEQQRQGPTIREDSKLPAISAMPDSGFARINMARPPDFERIQQSSLQSQEMPSIETNTLALRTSEGQQGPSRVAGSMLHSSLYPALEQEVSSRADESRSGSSLYRPLTQQASSRPGESMLGSSFDPSSIGLLGNVSEQNQEARALPALPSHIDQAPSDPTLTHLSASLPYGTVNVQEAPPSDFAQRLAAALGQDVEEDRDDDPFEPVPLPEDDDIKHTFDDTKSQSK